MVLVIAKEYIVKLIPALGVLCHNLMEVEVEVSVVPFLCGSMTEFDPKVTFRDPIERFRRGSSARRNGQRRLRRSRRGRRANLGHVVQGAAQVVGVVKGRRGS